MSRLTKGWDTACNSWSCMTGGFPDMVSTTSLVLDNVNTFGYERLLWVEFKVDPLCLACDNKHRKLFLNFLDYWWKKSCTTRDVENSMKPVTLAISTGARFFPSTVSISWFHQRFWKLLIYFHPKSLAGGLEFSSNSWGCWDTQKCARDLWPKPSRGNPKLV